MKVNGIKHGCWLTRDLCVCAEVRERTTSRNAAAAGRAVGKQIPMIGWSEDARYTPTNAACVFNHPICHATWWDCLEAN